MSDIIEESKGKTAFLDTVAARLVAVAVAAGVGYLLYVSHLYYQRAPGGALAGVDRAEYEACVSGRMTAFEKVAEGAGYSDQQRADARNAALASANAICAEMARANNSAPAGSSVRQ